MKKTSLIVLQPSSFCNINCHYCYVPERDVFKVVTDELMEETIQKLLTSDMLNENVMFLWHAGEPLAVGIEFYEKAINLINKYNIKNRKIVYSVQTNATLINDDWCEFFKKHSFKVGVSLDGPEYLHDANRVGWNGKGTFSKVMKGVECLKKHNIRLAAICVISNKTLNYPNELFDFFYQNGFERLSLVLENIVGENKGTTFDNNLNSFIEIKNKYSNFIQTLLSKWLPVQDKMVIREFQEACYGIKRSLTDKNFQVISDEVMELNILTIQNNGDITTYCPELAGGLPEDRRAFVIGNIKEISKLEDIVNNSNFLKIKNAINKGLENCKNSCQYFKLCGGRSPANKMYETGSFESTETNHCKLHRQALTDIVLNQLMKMSQTPAMS